MSKTIYLDTNVYMDFLLDRNSSAFKLIARAIKCEFHILFSDVVVEELITNNLEIECANVIRILKNANKITLIRTTNEDDLCAKNLLKSNNTHYADALHKVLAKKYGAEIFVTRNIKDFICFDDIVIKSPDII